MFEISHLLLLADTYQKATGLSDVTLSFRVFGDSKKLTALRADSDITTGRFNAAVHWFSTHWPADAEWPSQVARPAPQNAGAAA